MRMIAPLVSLLVIGSAFTARSFAAAPSIQNGVIEHWPADYGYGFDPSHHHRSAKTPKAQRFVYRGSIESPDWSRGGPPDGTSSVIDYGGLEKGRFAYDPAHHIAFFNAGCCTMFESILTEAPAPPARFLARDLRDVHTTLGLRLGDPPWRVREVLGPATLLSVPNDSTLSELSYVTSKNTGNACAWWTDIFFRARRAVRIELWDGC